MEHTLFTINIKVTIAALYCLATHYKFNLAQVIFEIYNFSFTQYFLGQVKLYYLKLNELHSNYFIFTFVKKDFLNIIVFIPFIIIIKTIIEFFIQDLIFQDLNQEEFLIPSLFLFLLHNLIILAKNY